MCLARLLVCRPVVLLLVSVVVGLGCDDQSADRQVHGDVERARQLAVAGSEAALGEARQLLEQAASNAAASPAVQANAKSLLAQVELEAARTAQRGIDQQMMRLSRLAADISQLAQQIATTNALIAGYRQYDPRQTLAAIERNIADATGGAEKSAWFTHENTQIPTLAVLRQEISRLEGELAALQEKLDQLNAQRSEVLQQADQAARQAEGPRDERTLAAFKRASELRKQATDLATEIERTQAFMVPLRNDLAVAQSQQQVIEGLIADLQKQAEAQTRGWQAIQQQMAAQTALSRAILEGAGGGASEALVPQGGSIREKAVELDAVVQELRTQREQALENARNAAEHYGQAVALAEQLRQDLSNRLGDPKNQSRPERSSWEALRDVMHPATFRLHQASALRTLAASHGTEAIEYTTRIELRSLLQPILEAAGLPLPDELLAPNLERDLAEAVGAANEAYAEADSLLQNITEGLAQPEVQNAAYIARILTLYGWSQLNRVNNDQQAAQEHLEMAQQVKSAAVDRGLVLPALPEGLGGVEPATTPAAPEPPAEPAAATTPPVPDDAPAPAPPPEAPSEPEPQTPAEPEPDAPSEPEPDAPAEPEPGA